MPPGLEPSERGTVSYFTSSPAETIELGRKMGEVLREGDVVALSGELGTGKTCLTKGLALGLGVPDADDVISPTFTLVNEYVGARFPLYHLDAYRIESIEDFQRAGLDEFFYAGGVAVLEWADKWPALLPAYSIRVTLAIAGESSAGHILRISIEDPPPRLIF